MNKITISQERPLFDLYEHQNIAHHELMQLYEQNNEFKGIVCIPTGGGKTHTAVIWGLQNFIAKGKKIIWLAHRHELLNQAYESFQKNAYSKYLKTRTEPINIRLISSEHEKVNSINGQEDVIIISNITYGKNVENISAILKENDNEEVLLIIDEAHHAPAKTYRNGIQGCCKNFTTTLIGLTATPYRTLEAERGAMNKIFHDDIIYKIGLSDLITRGILAEPQIEDIKTNIDFKDAAKQYTQNLHLGDFNLPDTVSSELQGMLDNRNSYIVQTYIKDRKTFGQTLIFTINRANAFALNELFLKNDIKSSYIVSGEQTPKQREKILNNFRTGITEVLINVNILTEGTDVPNIQTVFLARPTMSPILLMQMMGRGLRGTEAGGTEVCYIRSFIDEWEDKIDWSNPTELIKDQFSFESTNANKKTYAKYIIEKEAIKALMDAELFDEEAFNNMVFINKVPIGFYHFNYTYIKDESNHDKKCNVLVFCFNQKRYEKFIDDLPLYNKKFVNFEDDTLPKNNEIVTQVLNDISTNCFNDDTWAKREWIENILNYYYQKEELPQFIPFEDRINYNIESIARHIVNEDFGKRASRKYCQAEYKKSEEQWSAFLGIGSETKFINYVENEANRILEFEEGNLAEEPYLHSDLIEIKKEETRDEPILKKPKGLELVFLSLDELRREKVKRKWVDIYEQIKTPTIKNIFFNTTDTEGFGIPKTQEVIAKFIDERVDPLNYRGVGVSKINEYDETVQELKEYLIHITKLNKEDTYLEDYELNEEDSIFVSEFNKENGYYPAFFLLSKEIERIPNLDIKKDIILKRYFNIFQHTDKLERKTIAKNIGYSTARVDQIIKDFYPVFKKKHLKSIIEKLNFNSYKIESIENFLDTIKRQEKHHLTDDFILYTCANTIFENHNLFLIGNQDNKLFGIPNLDYKWSQFYIVKRPLKDFVRDTITQISSILSNRYTEFEVFDLQENTNLTELDIIDKKQVLKILNEEGKVFRVKKHKRADYSPIPFHLTDEFILKIKTSNNTHKEELRQLFYELEPNTALMSKEVNTYFKEGNEYGFKPTKVPGIKRLGEELNIILVAERWMTIDFLKQFVSIENIRNKPEYKGRRKPSRIDLMVEMVLFDPTKNGYTRAEWCKFFNEYFYPKTPISQNNLHLITDDIRFINKERKELYNSINGKAPTGYYLKELEN